MTLRGAAIGVSLVLAIASLAQAQVQEAIAFADIPNAFRNGRTAKIQSVAPNANTKTIVAADWPGITLKIQVSGVLGLDVSMYQTWSKNPENEDNNRVSWFRATLIDTITEEALEEAQWSTSDQAVNITTEAVIYELFTSMNPGRNYTLVLVKMTEADYSVGDITRNYVEFHQLIVTSAIPGMAAVSPAPIPRRRIEFLGDSITCGFCNECHAKPAVPYYGQQNYIRSWAQVTCAAFGADCHTEAYSGFGVYRNCCGGNVTLPMLFNRTVATDPDVMWPFSTTSWIPDVVVINLGTNDHLDGLDPWGNTETQFRVVYTAMLRQIVHYYGSGVPILMACGPMSEEYCPAVFDIMQGAQSWANLHFLDHRGILNTTNTCCGHPDVTADVVMADITIADITAVTGWSTMSQTSFVEAYDPRRF